MPTRPRVLIAEDHTLIAELCKKLLDVEYEVVGIVDNGRAMVRAAMQLKPHVILVDIAMPDLNGIDAGRQVKETDPKIKLIYLTMNSDPKVAAELLRCGGSGYLVKTCAVSEILLAVREVLRGNVYISRTLPKEKIRELQQENENNDRVEEPERLTARQREVLQLLAEGKVMKEVGAILNMETRTVAFHKYRIMEKLGLKSNAELVRLAVRKRLVAA